MDSQNIYERVCVASDILSLMVHKSDDISLLAMFNVYMKEINERIDRNTLDANAIVQIKKLKDIMLVKTSLIPDELTYTCTYNTLLKMT
jgi:hypothetical protein